MALRKAEKSTAVLAEIFKGLFVIYLLKHLTYFRNMASLFERMLYKCLEKKYCEINCKSNREG
jgi:hypothetical protein